MRLAERVLSRTTGSATILRELRHNSRRILEQFDENSSRIYAGYYGNRRWEADIQFNKQQKHLAARTEFELLHLLLVNRGKVLSRQELMDTVWAGVIVTDRTVNVNITRLRKKLGPYAQNIASRTGYGYVFEE